jgi:hypothetical protein
MPVPAVIESLGGRVLWSGATAWVTKIAQRKIQITSPRPQERLQDRQEHPGGGVSYIVRGTLKKLPAGEEIWLLIEDEVTKKFWPQSGYAVQFNPITGEWHGRISDHRPDKFVKIIAIVAPPTSQQLFRYYDKVGEKTGYEPLDAIPPECINRAHVQGERGK